MALIWFLAQIVVVLLLTGGMLFLLGYACLVFHFAQMNPDEPLNGQTYREAHRHE